MFFFVLKFFPPINLLERKHSVNLIVYVCILTENIEVRLETKVKAVLIFAIILPTEICQSQAEDFYFLVQIVRQPVSCCAIPCSMI